MRGARGTHHFIVSSLARRVVRERAISKKSAVTFCALGSTTFRPSDAEPTRDLNLPHNQS
jgi:hypothetical protein